MSLLCLSMRLIHTNLPPSTTPYPPRHPCLLFPILIFHTRSVMCSNHIAATRESSQVDCLAGFFLFAFFCSACAIGTCGEGMTEAMRCFAVDVDCCANALPQAAICLKGERLMRTLLFEWCVATFILPEFVNYVFFFLRNLLYLILCINVFPT